MSGKVFRVRGEVRKKKFFEPLVFDKRVVALKESHALERVYAEMGSRHRAKRSEIIIHSVMVEQEE